MSKSREPRIPLCTARPGKTPGEDVDKIWEPITEITTFATTIPPPASGAQILVAELFPHPNVSSPAFQLFGHWITKGLPSVKSGNPLTETLYSIDICCWFEFYQLLSGWGIYRKVQIEVVKWIVNILILKHAACDWTNPQSTEQLLRKLAGHYLAANLDTRMIIVHFLAMDFGFIRVEETSYLNFLSTAQTANLLYDRAHWITYMQRQTGSEEDNAIDWDKWGSVHRKVFATDDAHTDLMLCAQDIEEFLLPHLFDGKYWKRLFATTTGQQS